MKKENPVESKLRHCKYRGKDDNRRIWKESIVLSSNKGVFFEVTKEFSLSEWSLKELHEEFADIYAKSRRLEDALSKCKKIAKSRGFIVRNVL